MAEAAARAGSATLSARGEAVYEVQVSQPRTELAALTTLGVGGEAELLLSVQGEAEIHQALELSQKKELPILVLGGGSNLVVSDQGVRACVLQVENTELSFTPEAEDVLVVAGAGLNWDQFVSAMVDQDLQGVECLSGIPGCVGATPIQNVGAYGQEVAETIEEVLAFDLTTGQTVSLSHKHCAFYYRDSYFKRAGAGRFVVVSVTFRLRRHAQPSLRYGELSRRLEGQVPTLALVRKHVLDLRREKSMLSDASDENHRSCGSFFLNVQVPEAALEEIASLAGEAPPRFPAPTGLVKLPAAWLIEHAGLRRGERRGTVGLSTKHALCLVAHDGATASDVIRFAWEIRHRVEDAYGLTLVPEPRFWGFEKLESGLPQLEKA